MNYLTRRIKNYIGKLKGYSTCPNCNDSWYWKESDSLMFSDDTSVLICKECLSKPQELNIKRIINDLKSYGWNTKDLSLVMKALHKLRNNP
jgi:transcription elongation factor Elf1